MWASSAAFERLPVFTNEQSISSLRSMTSSFNIERKLYPLNTDAVLDLKIVRR